MITVGQIRELIKDSKDEDYFLVTSNVNVMTQEAYAEALKPKPVEEAPVEVVEEVK